MNILTLRGATNPLSVHNQLTKILSPAIRKAGWNPAQIQTLARKLHAILVNFNRITKTHWNLAIALRAESQGNQDKVASFDRAAKTVYVYLQPGPEIVLALAPAFVGMELVEFIYSASMDPKEEFIGLNFGLTKFHELSLSGIEAIGRFYAEKRGLAPADSSLHDNFFKTAHELGQRMMKFKIAYLLQGRETHPGAEIPIFVREFLAALREELVSATDPSKMNFLKILARLALTASLAKRTGQAQIYWQCREELKNVFAVQLSMIEFAVISSANLAYYQKFPIETTAQINLGIEGFTLVFNRFVMVFGNIYDSVEMG